MSRILNISWLHNEAIIPTLVDRQLLPTDRDFIERLSSVPSVNVCEDVYTYLFCVHFDRLPSKALIETCFISVSDDSCGYFKPRGGGKPRHVMKEEHIIRRFPIGARLYVPLKEALGRFTGKYELQAFYLWRADLPTVIVGINLQKNNYFPLPEPSEVLDTFSSVMTARPTTGLHLN